MKRAGESIGEVKRPHEDETGFTINWHTRDGVLTSTYARSFLAKHSEFFAGLFRTSYKEDVDIKLPYPKETIQSLFLHLDGKSQSLTQREELMLSEVIDFLCLDEDYTKVDNVGFLANICYWCSNEADDSFCLAKRWTLVNNRQQCLICCELIQYCACDFARGKHDDSKKRVWDIKGLTFRK